MPTQIVNSKTGMSYFKADRLIGTIVLSLCVVCSVIAQPAQTRHRQSPKTPAQTSTKTPKAEPTPTPQPDDQRQIDTVKVDTDLVTVPVVVTDANGKNVPKLQQEDFQVAEDGKPQQIALFATTRLPVSVVLLLDTSASTRDKLTVIQNAAVAFVEKLESTDRVKVISFGSKVRDLSPFSSDRATLKAAISKTTPGEGTKLYDAVEFALAALRKLEGRKAIVLFSDGVDWHSDQASEFSTLHWLDEEGVTVYPIRYDTRELSERILRGADEDAPPLPTIDVIRKSKGGTTEPTFPGDEPTEGPPVGQPPKTGPLGLPTAEEIMKNTRRREPTEARLPTPPPRKPTPGTEKKKSKSETETRGRHGGDPVTEMLDRMYLVADKYLNNLADNSGGIVLKVNDLSMLPDAFAQVATELQLQYVLGYYPTNKSHDGEYRNISVTVRRQQLTIRARPGYRAP